MTGWASRAEAIRAHAERRRGDLAKRLEQCRQVVGSARQHRASSAALISHLWADVDVRRRAAELAVRADAGPSRRLRYFDADFCLVGDEVTVLTALLDAAVSLTGADLGNVQLDAGRRTLRIVAQRGFDAPFLDHFAVVVGGDPAGGGTACGLARAGGRTVHVPDVARSNIFGPESRDVILAAGVRAVRSMPLRDPDGAVLGVFSVHYRRPYRPDASEERILTALATSAARRLHVLRGS